MAKVLFANIKCGPGKELAGMSGSCRKASDREKARRDVYSVVKSIYLQ